MEKIIFRCLFLMIFLFSYTFTRAEVPATEKKTVKKHSAGLHVGLTTGSGPAYRHWLESGSGFEIALFPYYQVGESEQDARVNIGLTYLKSFSVSSDINLFGYLGAAWYWDYHNDDDDNVYDPDSEDNDPDYNYERDHEEHRLNIGLGPGLEYHFSSFQVTIMVGIASLNDIEQIPSRSMAWEKTFSLSPTGELGFYYCF